MCDYNYSKPRIELLIVQITSFCNIDCSYCYLANRNQKHHIDPHTITKIVDRLFEYGDVRPPFHWQWHAGEPLAVGLKRFVQRQDAMEAAFARHGVAVRTSLQTNGVLINAEWAKFLANRGIGVGLSIDGPKEFHDEKRRDRAGRGTHEAAVRGLTLLLSEGMTPSVLCVVGPRSLQAGAEILRFFGAAGVQNLAFNFEEKEGENRSDAFAHCAPHELRIAVSKFVRDIVTARDEYYPSMRIREFDSFKEYLVDRRARRGLLTEPFRYLTITHRGDVITFSPELAGAFRADGSAWSFGNIAQDSLSEILERILMSKDYAAIRTGVEMCRKDCTYFSVCGGGSPVNKFFENGTFASTETSYCKMRFKYLVDGMLDHILAQGNALTP